MIQGQRNGCARVTLPNTPGFLALSIPAIAQPKSDLTSAEEAVHLSLDSELKVTRQIDALMDLAIQEKDHLSGNIYCSGSSTNSSKRFRAWRRCCA